MTATMARPDTGDRVDQLTRTNRGLTIAVVVLAVLALGLGAWAIWQTTAGDDAAAAPDGVSAVPDAWFAALEQGDNSVLDLYATGGFHQSGTERYFGDDIVGTLSGAGWTSEWITDPYVITNEGAGTNLVVRGIRNTQLASGTAWASALVYEIETTDNGEFEIASSTFIYRTN